MDKPVTISQFLLGLVVILLVTYYSVVRTDGVRYENEQLRRENEILRTHVERDKAAMKKQGVWEYRTQVLRQTLPQE